MTVTSLLREERIPISTEPDSEEMERTSILVVDDDERNLLALSEVLEDLADVVRARSGEEALRYLLRQRFAVIVLDVLMPGLDGYETAGLVRAREQSRDTPIIFLTAINKEDAHLLRGYDSGAVDFVFKPFDPTIVRSKVSVFVSLHEKSLEIQRTAAAQKRLLEEKLLAQQQSMQALKALRESEQRQEAILRSLPICFHSRDAAPPFGARFVSEAVERLTGFPPERLTNEPEFGLSRVHPEDLPHLVEVLKGAARSGSYSAEFRWRCADGTYRTFLDQGVISKGTDGNPAEIFGTLLDVTEQRLLEDQLLQAQKMDAIGKLTGGIAHDFNNLLASVLSGLSLLKRRAGLDDRSVEVLEMTRHAAEQGKYLVSRLLAFSRRQTLAPRVVDLSGISRSLDAMLAPILGGLVTLTWEREPGLWNTFVDSAQLELAIMNLVINARDALPDGGAISIKLGNRLHSGSDDLPSGQYVVVTVSDTGSGIPTELLSKVIEPFFTTKDVGKGTGLGLSTAYGFARQSGGTLRISSVADQGTNVEIWLPRSSETAASSGAIPHIEPESTTTASRLTHVLLVDDSQTLRSLTEMQLAAEGFAVSTASSGSEAIAMIDREPDLFDLILTDFAMPLMSGVELVKAARGRRADWPAVIVTGYAQTEALNGRPEDVPVLAKPFTTAALVDTIEHCLRRGSGQHGARPGTQGS